MARELFQVLIVFKLLGVSMASVLAESLGIFKWTCIRNTHIFYIYIYILFISVFPRPCDVDGLGHTFCSREKYSDTEPW